MCVCVCAVSLCKLCQRDDKQISQYCDKIMHFAILSLFYHIYLVFQYVNVQVWYSVYLQMKELNEKVKYVHYHRGREYIGFQLPSFQHNFCFLKNDTTLPCIFELFWGIVTLFSYLGHSRNLEDCSCHCFH